MAVAFVRQSAEATAGPGTSVSPALTGANKPTAGNLLVLITHAASNGGTITSVSDGTNPWNLAINKTDYTTPTDGLISIYYAENVAGANTTVTVTYDTSQTLRAVLFEVSGCSTTTALGPTSSAGSTTGTTYAPGTVTPTVADNIIFSDVYSGTSGPASAKSGYTDYGAFNTVWYGRIQYKTTTSTASEDPDFTGPSTNWNVIAAVFQADGSGPTIDPGLRTLSLTGVGV